METNQNVSLSKRWKEFSSRPTFPRFVIIIFFGLVCLTAIMQGLDFPQLMSASLVRFGMNVILVLAMVPAIQSGIGPNFGLPIGVIAGLLGMTITFQLNYNYPALITEGWVAFFVAIALSIIIGIIMGYLYGLILNRVKGSEMIVSTYIGFSIVFLMSISWILLPFTDERMSWPLGPGLRNVISLDGAFNKLLNDFMSIKILREVSSGKLITLFNKTESFVTHNYDTELYHAVFEIPIVMLLFAALVCLMVWLFTKSKAGAMLKATGDNPRFALANGINVDFYRLVGATLSTVLASVGIVVFSQSYGYMQLYQGPLMAAFPAVAAILIGGASAKRATIVHVLIGTFLFQSLLAIALPAANALFPEGNLSEVIRQVVQNGVILFALMQVGGDS